MVRLVVHLEGVSESTLLEASPTLDVLLRYRGSLQQAPGPAAKNSRRVAWPHILRPAETASASECVAAHQALVRKVARLARSDLLPEVTRVELPLVSHLQATGMPEKRAHALAAEALLALNRVAGPEVLVITWTGTGIVTAAAPAARDGTVDGPGWRSSVPIPAWTEADLLTALRTSV